MIKLNPIADNDPLLNQSKLLYALEQTVRYAEENNGIGLTQTKLFNRKFAHWAHRISTGPHIQRKSCCGSKRC